MERPTSITIIGWFLIISSALGLLSMAVMQKNPDAMAILEQSKLGATNQMILGAVGAIITAVCGYGILQGKNWGRMGYLGWSVIGILVGFLTMPMQTLQMLGVAFFIVSAFFLFRPAANAFFNRNSPAGA